MPKQILAIRPGKVLRQTVIILLTRMPWRKYLASNYLKSKMLHILVKITYISVLLRLSTGKQFIWAVYLAFVQIIEPMRIIMVMMTMMMMTNLLLTRVTRTICALLYNCYSRDKYKVIVTRSAKQTYKFKLNYQELTKIQIQSTDAQ
jgi:hypothetical protein